MPNEKNSLPKKIGQIAASIFKQEYVEPINELPSSDIYSYGVGGLTVATLLSEREGKSAAKHRNTIYQKWSEMEANPIISTSIGLLVTAALGGHESTGDVVFIETASDCDEKTEKIVKEISDALSPILNAHAYALSYTAACFGDAYARIYSEEKKGVVDLYTDAYVRPQLVVPYEKGSRTVGYGIFIGIRKQFEKLDSTQMARLKMPRVQFVPQQGVVEKAFKFNITEDQIDDLPILPAFAGGSLLYNAEEAYDNLTKSLIGLVGQRWQDSIDESIITANVDGMAKAQREIFLKSVVTMLSKSKELAEKAITGRRPILEKIRHILPVSSDKQLLSIGGNTSGRSSQMTIDDVMVHARLLAGALGVDLSMIGFADQMSGGLGEGGFFRISAQVAERAKLIRSSLEGFCHQVIDVHMYKKYGYVYESNNRPYKINFSGSISALEAEKQKTTTEAMNGALQLAQIIQMLKDLNFDKGMMKDFLMKKTMLDESQAELYSKVTDQSETSNDEGKNGFI